MRKSKPFDTNANPFENLVEKDFYLSIDEKLSIYQFYSEIIDFEKESFNSLKLKSIFNYMGGVRFNYIEDCGDDEKYIKNVFLRTESKKGYFIPLTFSKEELLTFRDFEPELIAKLDLTVINYLRVIGSLVSIYTGVFLIMPEKMDFLMIISNGDFIVSLHKKEIDVVSSNLDLLGVSEYYDKALNSILNIYLI